MGFIRFICSVSSHSALHILIVSLLHSVAILRCSTINLLCSIESILNMLRSAVVTAVSILCVGGMERVLVMIWAVRSGISWWTFLLSRRSLIVPCVLRPRHLSHVLCVALYVHIRLVGVRCIRGVQCIRCIVRLIPVGQVHWNAIHLLNPIHHGVASKHILVRHWLRPRGRRKWRWIRCRLLMRALSVIVVSQQIVCSLRWSIRRGSGRHPVVAVGLSRVGPLHIHPIRRRQMR